MNRIDKLDAHRRLESNQKWLKLNYQYVQCCQ